MAKVRAIDGTLVTTLSGGWSCAALAAGSVSDPAGLEAASARWFDARVPGTAASALAAAKAWSLDDGRDFDESDWWFRAKVDLTPREADEKVILRFDGLATLADVWLDGAHVLRSDNMFLAHDVDVTGHGGPGELVLRFASITEELKKRRPRPRWRAQIVAQQQLRWIRTALLGRIPAWSPPVAPVGPYRAIAVERRGRVCVLSADARTRVEGRDGALDIALRLATVGPALIRSVSLAVGAAVTELVTESQADGAVVARGTLTIPDVALWWPATHGAPTLHDVVVVAHTDRGDVKMDLGRTGFRTITLDREGGGFGVRVNGVDVFARGAVWTPLDLVGITDGDDLQDLRAALTMAARAGMNMLRVGGTMGYAPETFHDLCDELGIMVWQDFMFANMDYPIADEAFAASVRAEATQLASRLQLSPSLAIFCGNSEVAQQAAMLGLPEKEWSGPLFDELLPAVARAARPDVPYVASTPEGGALPFRVDEGVSHYYGVGAYLRPLEDARRSRVRFTAECLAFANVPCDETIEGLLRDGESPPNHPRWKARVPRDRGASWDFEDVRDHYLGRLFGVDPALLRAADVARYLELGRVVTGEAMLATISEFRRAGSECKGALVWLLRDLWAGAGWGVVDANGRPKAAYHYLARAFAPVALLATDEGLNGLTFHAVNDGPVALDTEVRVTLYRGDVRVVEGAAPVAVPARGVTAISADSVLGRFVDTTYAYRFGPPGHDLVVGTLVDRKDGACIGRAFHFPCGTPHARAADLGVEAVATPGPAETWRVTVRAKRLALAVAFDARGFVADDEFFHVEPGGERTVTLHGLRTDASPGRVVPLNAASPTKIVVAKT